MVCQMNYTNLLFKIPVDEKCKTVKGNKNAREEFIGVSSYHIMLPPIFISYKKVTLFSHWTEVTEKKTIHLPKIH